MDTRVAVVGLGYVGLPLSLAFARSGCDVVGLDNDPAVVEALGSGHSHIGDVAHADVAAALDAGLAVNGDAASLAGCDAIVICVPTPLTEAGGPDTRFIEAAVAAIAPVVVRGTLVVLESTSYPGTTEEIVAQPLARATGLQAGVDFCVAFSPERIDPGNSDFGIANTPRIVAGLLPCCQAAAAELYGRIVDRVVPASGLKEAELAKLVENTYRHVNIALMNELVRFARLMDVDLHEAIRCAATKPFGFEPFYPGPGVGGHCIPIDPRILASRVESQLGRTFRLVELAQEINAGMPGYAVQRLADELSARDASLAGTTVLVLGASYKKNVADSRTSPAIDVVRELRSRGAVAVYADPAVASLVVDGVPVPRVDLDDVGHFGGVLLLQDHAAFRQLDVDAISGVCVDATGTRKGAHVVGL